MTLPSPESGVERVCRSVTGLVLLTVLAAGLVAACHTSRPGAGSDDAPPRAVVLAPIAPATSAAPEPSSAGAGSAAPSAITPSGSAASAPISSATRVVGSSKGESVAAGPRFAAPPSGSATPPVASAAPVASVAPPVIRRRGPVATGESYEAWLETTGAYAVGSPASVVVELSAKPPFKCNAQYPYKLALDSASGVTYPSPTARGMQVEGKHASMVVPFTPARPGTFTVGGTLSFSTCTADRCLVDKARISVPVDIR